MPPEKQPNKKTHYSGHRERLRKRFLDAPEKLPEYELLELLLGYVLIRADTKPLAKALLCRFGSLRGVFDARVEELQQVPGVGPGVEAYFRLMRETLARHAEGPVRKRQILCTPDAVAVMARKRLGQASAEEVWIAYVDNAIRLIAWEKAAQGGLNSSYVSPRDILERALTLRSSGFILVHNHPGGTCKPSGADIDLTKRLKHAAKLIGIAFHDHVIVTENVCYSMENEGLMQ